MSTTATRARAASLREDDQARAPAERRDEKAGGVANWVDERTGAGKGVAFLLKKVFPDHWSFMLGEIAHVLDDHLPALRHLPDLLVRARAPARSPTTAPTCRCRASPMSEAYRSTLDISFDVRGGLLIRQIHHWAALMFIVAVTVHMFRVFFTGAFRKPREINWVIGTILSMLAIVEGFAGYSLPDDLLSGTGLRAAEGFMQSIPIVGTTSPTSSSTGAFPGEAIIPRLYTVHVLLLPAHPRRPLHRAHPARRRPQAHPVPGPGHGPNNNVVGYPLMPVYMAKAGGFFFMVFGVIALIAALVTINPIWAYGPYDPSPSPPVPSRTGTWASPTVRCA